jgi:hypothetical protein
MKGSGGLHLFDSGIRCEPHAGADVAGFQTKHLSGMDAYESLPGVQEPAEVIIESLLPSNIGIDRERLQKQSGIIEIQ